MRIAFLLYLLVCSSVRADTHDEEAQAAYTRDFLTVCFSHPRVTGFNMWGFWEGDQWLPAGAFYRKDWSPKPNGKVLEELLTRTWWTDCCCENRPRWPCGRASISGPAKNLGGD
jgi:hypothetical protein